MKMLESTTEKILVSTDADELRPEYEEALLASLLKSGVRGKYTERYHQGTNLVRLAPDIAAAFPTEQAVNDALRKLLESSSVSA